MIQTILSLCITLTIQYTKIVSPYELTTILDKIDLFWDLFHLEFK
jgi:hypothetical protein